MEHLKSDLRDAFRQLKKKPGFTTTVIITLALGIGANSAIFSVIHAALLRPLPYPDAHRLILVYNNILQANVRQIPLSPPEYLDYSSQTRTFEQSAAFATGSFNLTGNDEPERLQGATVSASFFHVLGIGAFSFTVWV